MGGGSHGIKLQNLKTIRSGSLASAVLVKSTATADPVELKASQIACESLKLPTYTCGANSGNEGKWCNGCEILQF